MVLEDLVAQINSAYYLARTRSVGRRQFLARAFQQRAFRNDDIDSWRKTAAGP
jgi:hypothetical protein